MLHIPCFILNVRPNIHTLYRFSSGSWGNL
jgi:hypothetical protein